MSRNQQPNPYASAAGAYGSNAQKSSTDPRELEARVLLKATQALVDLQAVWDERPKEALEDTLRYNRTIWMMFYDTAVENKDSQERPVELRNNIYNLANFIFKREVDIMAKPEKRKLDILIKINREIAAGLMAGAKSAAVPSPQANESMAAKMPPAGGHNQSV